MQMPKFQPAVNEPTELVVELDTMREFYRLAEGRWTKLERKGSGSWEVSVAVASHDAWGKGFPGTTLQSALERAIRALKGESE